MSLHTQKIKSDCLVLVDIQKEYIETNFFEKYNWELFVNEVSSLTRYFINNNRPVILLRHSCCNEFIDEILNVTKRHKKLYQTQKNGYDGSWALYKLFNNMRENISSVFLAGLYTQLCVLHTAEGLINKGFNVNIHPKTCYGHYSFPTESYLKIDQSKNLLTIH